MEQILEVRHWADKWLSSMKDALYKKDKIAVSRLLDEEVDYPIIWNRDASPVQMKQYDQIVNDAYNLLIGK